MSSTLYLIDGHALAYRTYYALTRGGTASERWLTSKGEPTAGVYGFTSVLLRILEQERPDYVAVVFDKGKTFRDDLYPEYKATRTKMPEDLRPQIDRIRELVDSFNIPRFEKEGYEADDVLGSLAHWAVDHDLTVKIITGDRDLLQLVNDRIIVKLPGRSLSKAKDYFREDVKKTMGVWPEQVIDYKALTGDRSDNIPGVYGVGEKTATSLLKKYQSLDEIYKHLDEVQTRFRNKLEEGREDAYLSKKLATIVNDLSVELDLEQAKPEKFDPQQVRKKFQELEFRTLQDRLETVEKIYGKEQEGQQLSFFSAEQARQTERGDNGEQHPQAVYVEIIDDEEGLQDLLEVLQNAAVISFDTETTSTDQMKAELVGISLAVDGGHGYYIPLGHEPERGNQLPMERVFDVLGPVMSDPSVPKMGHNLKYDYIVLLRHGLEVGPLSFDSMIAEWVINPSSRNLGLKNLAWVRLNRSMVDIEELIGKGRDQITMAQVGIKEAAKYAVDDAIVVLQLKPILEEELERVEGKGLFSDLEMPLIPVLADMEMRGIRVDRGFLEDMSQRLDAEMQALEEKIFAEVGQTFNLNSPQQLSKAVFETLDLDPPNRTKKTASGYYSTAADVLEEMGDDHPVPRWVLDYRELSKLKSTYVDALQDQINPDTKRVHTSYNQTGSVTGRIASSDPNLQNIPIRTKIGREVRKAFIPSPEWLLIAVDYSQIELRVVAHMAQDQAMLSAFEEHQDIHATTAAAIFEIPLQEVSKKQRRQAKAINFGLIYGMSAFGLTRSTDLTLAEAEDFREAYFSRFPGVKRYLDRVRKKAKEEGYVETLFGRRRYFPRLKTTTNYNIRQRGEREAINAPIQGTAADIMKKAMLDVYHVLEDSNLQTRMLLQVHDELVFEAPRNELDQTIQVVQTTMEDTVELSVPLLTEARFGENWGALKDYSSAEKREDVKEGQNDDGR
ncbi:MAG: DNA polymerase I [Anaerolineales bacterium]